MLCFSLSRVRLCATPWTVACQAPLSIGFSREEYWSGLLFPSPGDLPDPGIEPGSPALQADSLPAELTGKPRFIHSSVYILYIAVYICQSFSSSHSWAFLNSVSSSSELSNVRGALWGLLNFQPSWTEEWVALGPVTGTWSGSRLVELSPNLCGSALTLGS